MKPINFCIWVVMPLGSWALIIAAVRAVMA